MKKLLSVFFVLACAAALYAQVAPSAAAPPASSVPAPASLTQDPSAAKARAILDQMVQALGGQRWLNLQNSYTHGSIAAFYQGKPTGVTVNFWSWHTPTADRIDLDETKHDKHNWVQVFTGNRCWEITFRGRNPLPKDQCEEDIRRHDHSIETAVKVWMNDPSTVLMYEGQSLVETKLAQQVTLLNTQNDAITIRVDADTHLPLSRSFSWRDPVYHDKDEDLEEYDDYHPIDGLPTPFAITRFHNGDMTQQRFVLKAGYNVTLPPDGFDLTAIAAGIHH